MPLQKKRPSPWYLGFLLVDDDKLVGHDWNGWNPERFSNKSGMLQKANLRLDMCHVAAFPRTKPKRLSQEELAPQTLQLHPVTCSPGRACSFFHNPASFQIYIWSLRSAALSLHAIHQGLYNSRQFKKIIIVGSSSPSQHPACLMKDGFMRCSHTRVPQENCPSGDRKRTCPKISWGGNTLTTEILPEISKQ